MKPIMVEPGTIEWVQTFLEKRQPHLGQPRLVG